MKKNYFLFIAIVSALMVNHLQAITYYSKSSGNLNLETTWGTNTDGSGTSPAVGEFTSITAHTFIVCNRAAFTHATAWTLNSSKTVVVGDGISAINLTIGGINGKIQGASLQVLNTATLTIVKAGALPSSIFIALDNQSTVVYNLAGLVVIDASYGNLVISNNASIIAPTTVNTSLAIAAGKTFDISGESIDINGTITSATGQFITNNSSEINVHSNVSGNIGTLRISGTTPTVKNLNVSCSNQSAYITLGNNLFVQDDGSSSSYFNYDNGGIDLAGFTITVDATSDANFPFAATDGFLKGSSGSSLIINSSVAAFGGSNVLYMDQTSAASQSLKVLVINNAGAVLSLGNNLNITDSVKVSAGDLDFAGNLTLKSTAALKGRLAQVGGTVSGNIKVETFIPGGSAGWANLGPAGVSGLSVSNWDGGGGSSTGFAMTCSGCINDEYSAGGTYFVSIESDPSGTGSYVDLTSGDALTPGAGYWVYIGSSLTSAIDITQTNAGPVVTGGVSGSGFMSNPYPSPISVDRLKSHNGGLSSVDVYNANTGAFVTFNGGIPSAATIPMGQGFYANGIASINFLESDKVSNNTISLLKTASQASNASIGDVVQLQIIGSNGEVDDTYIRFHGNATTGFDNDLDGYKRYTTPGYVGYPGPYNKYTTIATVNTNKDYAINSLPYATTIDAVIPVKVKVSTTGNYSILPINIQNFPGNACITLKDKLLNVSHDLRTGAYVCHIEDTTSTVRFELTVCANQQSSTVGIKDISATNSLIFINQDKNGAYVKTSFETSTKATISAFNTMGQQLMADKEVEGKDNTTYLDLGNVHSQVVIIRVTTAKESSFKKIYIN